MEPVVTLRDHFDDRLNRLEEKVDHRLDRMEGKVDALLTRDTDTRVDLARHAGLPAMVAAAIAALSHYLGRQ